VKQMVSYRYVVVKDSDSRNRVVDSIEGRFETRCPDVRPRPRQVIGRLSNSRPFYRAATQRDGSRDRRT